MSVLQTVLIKWVNFKENVSSGTKKTVHNIEHIKRASVKQGFTVVEINEVNEMIRIYCYVSGSILNLIYKMKVVNLKN